MDSLEFEVFAFTHSDIHSLPGVESVTRLLTHPSYPAASQGWRYNRKIIVIGSNEIKKIMNKDEINKIKIKPNKIIVIGTSCAWVLRELHDDQ